VGNIIRLGDLRIIEHPFVFRIRQQYQSVEEPKLTVRSKQMMGESRTTLQAFFGLAENWIDGRVERGVS
jgi:hypothetical protein